LLRAVLQLALATLIAGCASLYFGDAGQAPQPPPQHRLAAWPDRDYWTGIVFNGHKIGFTHLALAPAAEAPGLFEIRSEAAFVLRFLGLDKRVQLKAFDVVRDDLVLVRFRYDYSIDGNAIALAGEQRGDALAVTVTQAGRTVEQLLAPGGPVYPQSVIALYPTLHGLAAGREYRYLVYSGEQQKVAEVTQRVLAWERSALFDGNAFHVETAMEGYQVQTWINARGQPLLEIGMNGILISGLEDEAQAKGFLSAASLNKAETLLEFTLVRPARPLAQPRAITAMRVALWGADRPVPSDAIQQCARAAGETVCEIRSAGAAPANASAAQAGDPRDLAASMTVPARDPAIRAMASTIAGGVADVRAQVSLLVAWITDNVRKAPVDVWSALDVLEKREAECQGHTYLYAAFARALGIPTRVVNGITYSEDYQGFLYHTWAESLVEGRWSAVDPTFGTFPADATHVKLVEGETLAELAPLVDWVGQLKLRVIAVEPTQ
jgi:hypothetical protein